MQYWFLGKLDPKRPDPKIAIKEAIKNYVD